MMNYLPSMTIESVYSFDFLGNVLTWLSIDTSNKLFKRVETEKGALDYVNSIQTASLLTLREHIYCKDAVKAGGFLIDVDKSQFVYCDFSISKIDKSKEIGLFKRKIEGGKECGIMDLSNFNSLWIFDINVRFIEFLDGIIIAEDYNYKNGSKICCYSRNGTLLWKSAVVGSKGEQVLINSIVGYDKKRIYMTSVNDEMISFNIGDGYQEILFKYKPMLMQSIIDSENNRIIGFGYVLYWEFDLAEKKFSEYNLADEFNLLQINVMVTSHINKIKNKLFFSSNFIGSDRISKIGAYDIIEKKITWLHKFDFEKGRVIRSPVPVIYENKMYVLDSKNRLHIFEEQIP